MSVPEVLATADRTVLQRVVDELVIRITAMVDENGDKLWNSVGRGALPSPNALALPAIGIVQGPEQTIHDLWPHTEKIVSIFLEFKFGRVLNVDSDDIFKYYLGKLQARLFGAKDNLTLGGLLAANVTETGSNPEIEDKNDPVPGGLLMLQVHYRHWTADPYHLVSEAPNYAYGSL